MIEQGDVYWVDLGRPFGSEPGYRRPYVVLQNDATNRSAIRTVIACAITTNLRLAAAPGNVRISAGEADLPEESVANVSQVVTLDKRRLAQKVGTLSSIRVGQIVNGIQILIQPAKVSNG